MRHANFEILPYPNFDDIEIWLEDIDNSKEILDVGFAKSVPIVKLKSDNARSPPNLTLTFFNSKCAIKIFRISQTCFFKNSATNLISYYFHNFLY